ncbi:hypothetical protein [Rhizobium leguminosarum]|uniref:hypothetical protein n=1 Tax=Rhizobium leguminosarum TaxID=384 RepID=UPI0011D13921|nr:hypothetical protein [Rhizobium leguminosarum]NKL23705.1 hypothetical protein [Rhizobium leguminosarum bv. viciae]
MTSEDLPHLPSLEEARERARRFIANRKAEGDVKLQKYKETAMALRIEAADEADGDLTLDRRNRGQESKFEI